MTIKINPRKIKIMVVESHRKTATDAVVILQRAGYQVTRQDSVVGSLSRKKLQPDLVVVYEEVGKSDLTYLRELLMYHIPILVISQPDLKSETLDRGADAHMAYPPDLRELLARVKVLLRRKKVDDPLTRR